MLSIIGQQGFVEERRFGPVCFGLLSFFRLAGFVLKPSQALSRVNRRESLPHETEILR